MSAAHRMAEDRPIRGWVKALFTIGRPPPVRPERPRPRPLRSDVRVFGVPCDGCRDQAGPCGCKTYCGLEYCCGPEATA